MLESDLSFVRDYLNEIENLIQQATQLLTKADDKVINLINNNILEKCDYNKIYNIILLLKEIEFNIKGVNKNEYFNNF